MSSIVLLFFGFSKGLSTMMAGDLYDLQSFNENEASKAICFWIGIKNYEVL